MPPRSPSPGFSVLDNDTSDLGSLTAPHPTLYNLGVSLSGVLTIPLAVALVRAFGRGKAVIGTALLTAVFGIGEIIDGLAREDCAASVNATCRAAEKAGRISTHHKIHNVESLFTFVALALAPLFAAWLFRSLERTWLAWASLAGGVLQLVCLPIFLAMYSNGTHGQGLVEVVELMAGTLWIAAVSVALMAPRARTSGRTSNSSSPSYLSG